MFGQADIKDSDYMLLLSRNKPRFVLFADSVGS
jgi:hypothetical protein